MSASEDSFDAAVDRLMASFGSDVELLGFGEALHGGEEILQMRNRLFRRLVEKHGFSAIAIESSFPRARLINEFIHGRGDTDFEKVREAGFGHGMGRLEANRELVEWMRAWNLGGGREAQLSFYGFDIPTGSMGVGSPRLVLAFVLDYLGHADAEFADIWRGRFRGIADDDAAWENPAVYMDPSKSIALTPEAAALRAGVEDFISAMRSRRPALEAATGAETWREALRHAEIARDLLCFHAAMGLRKPGESPAVVLGTRDACMAGNLDYIVRRERPHGRVLVFAHNSHLQRGIAEWPGQKYWGTDDDCRWWPAGAHLARDFGRRYAVVATAVGVSEDNGIGEPEPGTIESRLRGSEGFISVRDMNLRDVPTRTGSVKNPTYVPLNARAGENYDWIAWVPETAYNRGGPPLQAWEGKPADPEP